MQTDDFTISFQQGGSEQLVDVHVKPSTDDVDTYVCYLNGERIAQIRKDSGKWKQLWGKLEEEGIQRLGEQIDLELIK